MLETVQDIGQIYLPIDRVNHEPLVLHIDFALLHSHCVWLLAHRLFEFPVDHCFVCLQYFNEVKEISCYVQVVIYHVTDLFLGHGICLIRMDCFFLIFSEHVFEGEYCFFGLRCHLLFVHVISVNFIVS